MNTPIVVLFFAFSFWLGWSFGPSDEKVVEKIIEKEVEKKVYIKASEGVSLEELKRGEEVAKAYYEKAFMLFLANLGLKLSTSDEMELGNLLNNPQEYLARTKEKPRENSKPKVISEDGIFKEGLLSPQEVASLPEDLKEKARRNILSDPMESYGKSKYITEMRTLKRYLGEYKGELHFLKGKNKGLVHQVYMSLNFKKKGNGDLDGSFNLQLFNGENVYSDNRGTGGNRDVREIDGHLIIDVGPGWFFLFPNGRLNIGHYYQEGILQGIVRLEK